MLVLTRRIGQDTILTLQDGRAVVVTILRRHGYDGMSIGITAPPDVRIERGEIRERKSMSKRERSRQVTYRVVGHNKAGIFTARTPANAVAQFRRRFCLTLQTDPETGGWKGVSVEVLK